MAFIYQISYIYKGKGMQRYMYALVITLVLLAGTSAFCPSAGGEEAITAQEYEIFRQTLTAQRPWSAVNPETMAAAALIALFPSVFSQGKVRLVAAVLLLVSLGLALEKYPDFKHDQAAYRRHHDNSPLPTQTSE